MWKSSQTEVGPPHLARKRKFLTNPSDVLGMPSKNTRLQRVRARGDNRRQYKKAVRGRQKGTFQMAKMCEKSWSFSENERPYYVKMWNVPMWKRSENNVNI